ncbi:MAG: prepilin-type N-terminal cleavage/methylation domain-containing protein [Lysobacteraceae bacterium]
MSRRLPGQGRSRHRARGFTLLEVLVAVTLLALLLTLAWGSLRTAMQASRSGEALIARSEQARTVQRFLRRQLSQTLALPFERLEDDGVEMRFEGGDDFLRFVAPMPGYLSRGGPHVQTLVVSRGQLAFNHQQLNGYDPQSPEPERESVVLLDGIAGARFEFRDIDEDGELGDWQSDWDAVERLPLMVRLTVDFDRDDARRWPPFEVTVMAAASGMQPMFGGPRRGGARRPPRLPRDVR